MATQPDPAAQYGLLRRIDRAAVAIENMLIVVLLTGMIGLAGGQILMRNLWNMSVPWGDPLLRVSVLWIGMFGAMAAARHDRHIRINVLQRYLPVRFADISRMITELFSALICGLVSYYAVHLVMLDKGAGVRAFAGIPSWVCELIIPIGFGVMALRFLLSFIMLLTGAKTSADDERESR
ncbi:MAG: TRAP transporter small permease [Gammaproteobacteria bacterium]|jgi:TRAP-type C4-dicarboxylate transport system permease small subunit